MYQVVLDAGHGGKATGAIAPDPFPIKSQNDEINLDPKLTADQIQKMIKLSKEIESLGEELVQKFKKRH